MIFLQERRYGHRLLLFWCLQMSLNHMDKLCLLSPYTGNLKGALKLCTGDGQ